MGDQTITQEDFERFLAWLDPDRTRAGERLERIRCKLNSIFMAHGRRYPEEMADDCIDRVIRKLPEIVNSYVGSPEYYFLGVARNVEKEWIRKERPIELPGYGEVDDSDAAEKEDACLERCLAKLETADRELVIEYFRYVGRKKIDHRSALAAKLGISAMALRIRVHRIRQKLEECVRECLNGEMRPAYQ